MRRKLLGGAALLMAAFSLTEANATSCAVPPTCAQLGYVLNVEDCPNVYVMRCPFALTDDNQVYCHHALKKELVIGKILFDNGDVSKELIEGRTPIGVVFDEANRLAIALTDVKKDGSAGTERMRWTNNDYDIPNLETCDMHGSGYVDFDLTALISCAPDGRANTDKILACGSECGGAPAATAANTYKPAKCSAAFCGQGKWFLPSMKELNKIYEMKETVSDTLTFLKSYGATSLGSSYWSSNEASAYNAWVVSMSSKIQFTTYHKNGNVTTYDTPIRPVIKY